MALTQASRPTADELYPIDPAWSGLANQATVAAKRAMRAVASPIDGRFLGEVPKCQPEDVAYAAALARAAAPSWAAASLRRRADVIARFRDLLAKQRDRLLDLVHAENGKARVGALEEFLDAVLTAGYYAAKAPKALRPERRAGALPVLTSAYVCYQPKGLVGIIAPWNYPLTLAASDAVPALLAGNAVLLKPDSLTPLTGLCVVKLLRQAGLPHDVIQAVTGPGAELGTPIVDNSDFVMFTGSTAVGRQVAAQCGRRLIGCSAELGGKNALLVLDDAPFQRAVAGAVQAAFANTGQLCVSIERIYVQRPLFDRFAEAFASRAAALALGGGAGWEVDLGPLASPAQLAKVEAHVADAVRRGARLLAGGRRREDLGPLFYEPTVLAAVDASMALAQEETFGPVVSLFPVDSEEEAIRLANQTSYGLNASVWTGSPARGRAVAERLRAGTVNINEGYAAAWGSTDAPMGGFGVSGLGRRHGVEGLLKYTEPQTVARQRLWPLGPPAGVSRQRYAAFMTGGAKLLRGGLRPVWGRARRR
ncbi:MAG: succinate-semialdehyde dehydrogenase (NADP(+)) [Propionibacteriaceae bacterium]|jgi:succinate-semialdehyde dehydrogenase/glutarate-semialdehyde dehydrogenase|nr:succinate-semialdehyde dehydrogenase (NADP(+)) [Propionibacteriaceae bacterium]